MRGPEAGVLGPGISVARLEVEVDNPRARAQYERLGYTPVARTTSRWMRENADGRIVGHAAECISDGENTRLKDTHRLGIT